MRLGAVVGLGGERYGTGSTVSTIECTTNNSLWTVANVDVGVHRTNHKRTCALALRIHDQDNAHALCVRASEVEGLGMPVH